MLYVFIIDLSRTVSAPHSAKKIKETKLKNYCTCVCEWDGVIYVGGYRGVDTVGGDRYFRSLYDWFIGLIWGNRFISLDGWVFSIRAHRGKLYMLHCDSDKRWFVRVSDRYGRELQSWSHQDIPNLYSNKLLIYKNHIYIPDRSTHRISVYTLQGQTVSHISSCVLERNSTGLTLLPTGHIVLTQPNSNLVRCISIETRKSVWTTTLHSPSAVTANRKTGLIYVATGGAGTSRDGPTLQVLAPDTGW